MPTTRHSPAREHHGAAPSSLPLGDIMHELSLLRQAMESRFVEAGQKSDSLRTEVVGKLEANDKTVSELQLAVTDVTLSVDENQRAIQVVRAEVERREVELPDKVRAIVHEALEKHPRPSPSVPGSRRHRPLGESSPQEPRSADRKKDDAYDLARRSLRIWPVSREGNLVERTVEFLVNELRLDQQHATGLQIEVRRAGSNNSREKDQGGKTRTTVRDEVLVRFESVRERDDVRSFAKNLERKGRGLRLEVPDFLWPNFRVLQELGYELKQKNPNLRRNILFDDTNRDLKMDISTDSVSWKTVLPNEARKSLRRCRPSRAKRASISREELDSLLGGQAEDGEERMEESEHEEY